MTDTKDCIGMLLIVMWLYWLFVSILYVYTVCKFFVRVMVGG